METITVRIQGESDWVNFIFKVQELNRLKNPALFLPPISAKIGKLLDIGMETLSVDDKRAVEKLLAQYVANLNIYPMMIENGMKSLFITSFRAKGPKVGYMTRVAGAIQDHIANCLTLDLNNPTTPMPVDVGYTILLNLISKNQNYKKDKYHSSSVFNAIYQTAQSGFTEGIEIQNVQNSQYN